MDFLPKNLNTYAEAHSQVFEKTVLAEIERHTHLKELMPQMLSGYLQGQYLAFISRLVQPKYILEVGTFTGYSAICLAEGLVKDGHLYTIETNEELRDVVQTFFTKAGLCEKISMHIGDAIQLIDQFEEIFDLVFIDADKAHYPQYYDLIFPKVRVGGCILIDNVLWSGKVTKEIIEDKKTKAVHALNEKIQADDRVVNVLLPLRDGIMMVQKVKA